MFQIIDRNYCPSLQDIEDYVHNTAFHAFCIELHTFAKAKIEYSACSWERGWNIKFKKAGKTLCTIYPRENYFTVMVVIGKLEKAMVESILPTCSNALQEIYAQTKEGNGQRWLMIDIEDQERMYYEVLRLIHIRKNDGKEFYEN